MPSFLNRYLAHFLVVPCEVISDSQKQNIKASKANIFIVFQDKCFAKAKPTVEEQYLSRRVQIHSLCFVSIHKIFRSGRMNIKKIN